MGIQVTLWSRLWRAGALLVLPPVLVIGAAACGGSTDADSAIGTDLPGWIEDKALPVQEAYTFAADRPGVLSWIACYCGCSNLGHADSEDCFIRERPPEGPIVWDDHGSGCTTCVSIALDAKRLAGEDMPLPEIRAYIDAAYSGVGPGTATPLPPGTL